MRTQSEPSALGNKAQRQQRANPDAVDRQLMALADPTRRAVYDIVRAGPSSVSAVTSRMPVSQPAVSQHLRVLAEAGLVTATPSGARRIYRADPAGIASLRSWIDTLWDEVLDSFVDAAAEATGKQTNESPYDPTDDSQADPTPSKGMS